MEKEPASGLIHQANLLGICVKKNFELAPFQMKKCALICEEKVIATKAWSHCNDVLLFGLVSGKIPVHMRFPLTASYPIKIDRRSIDSMPQGCAQRWALKPLRKISERMAPPHIAIASKDSAASPEAPAHRADSG
jgi:hypothetical protein